MYNDKRFFAVIALVAGLVCGSVKAATVLVNAISDSSLGGVRAQLGAAKTVADLNHALDSLGDLSNRAVTTADKTNVLGLFDTGPNNIGSVLTDTTKINLCYKQDAYDAVKAKVADLANRFGSTFSSKLNAAASGNLYNKFATALVPPSNRMVRRP